MGGDIIDNLPAAFRLETGAPVLPSGHRVKDSRLQPGTSVDKARLPGIENASLDHVPGIVAENPDTLVQVSRIPFLSRSGSFFHRGIVGAPGFSVQQLLSRAEFRIQLRPDPVHQLHREQPHQIKAKSVHMVFFCPVHHGVRNIIIHHGAPCGNVIPAGGTIGQAAVLPVAVVVSRHHPLQPGIGLVSMIVNHIHDNPYTVLMQGLNHLLALPYPDYAVIRIRGIRALRHIIIHRVIAPVKLSFVSGFIYRAVVKKRKQMHMGDTQSFQIFHTGGISSARPFHGKSLIFPSVLPGDTALRIIGKILDMQFIDNPLPAILRCPVRFKSRRVGSGQIDYHASAAIAVTACRIRIRSAGIFSVYPNRVIVVYAVQIFRKFKLPYALFIRLHLPSEIRLFCNSVFIQAQFYSFRKRAPDFEHRPPICAACTQVFAVISKFPVKLLTGEKSHIFSYTLIHATSPTKNAAAIQYERYLQQHLDLFYIIPYITVKPNTRPSYCIYHSASRDFRANCTRKRLAEAPGEQ